jgi:hypothetical protein
MFSPTFLSLGNEQLLPPPHLPHNQSPTSFSGGHQTFEAYTTSSFLFQSSLTAASSSSAQQQQPLYPSSTTPPTATATTTPFRRRFLLPRHHHTDINNNNNHAQLHSHRNSTDAGGSPNATTPAHAHATAQAQQMSAPGDDEEEVVFVKQRPPLCSICLLKTAAVRHFRVQV